MYIVHRLRSNELMYEQKSNMSPEGHIKGIIS